MLKKKVTLFKVLRNEPTLRTITDQEEIAWTTL